MSAIVTASILVIGDEILSGAIKDKNIHFMTRYLTDLGIEINEIRIVPDGEEAVVEAIDSLRASND